MQKNISYTKYENKLMPHFRNMLNQSESDEDVKKFFQQTVQQLIDQVFDQQLPVNYGDVELAPENPPFYKTSQGLSQHQLFLDQSGNSDLNAILERFATPAAKRFKHFQNTTVKTELKIKKH